MTRNSGILLHPTSLPGRWGIGDLGAAAYTFVDFLAGSGQQLWQVMPLGPTGYGDSPYQGFSAFAGNPLLISLDRLLEEGLLDAGSLAGAPEFPDQHVDFGAVIPWKLNVLHQSFEHYKQHAPQALRDEFASFRTEQRTWLADYALFAAIKGAHGGASWNSWEPALARHEAHAIDEQGSRLSHETEFHAYMQWQFFRQWCALKEYANHRGIQIIGDIPIFVAFDSADVWGNREVFEIDEDGNPTVVAGVPPDYFSATGQLWGNPLYRWDALEERGYRWWIERFRTTLTLVDIARIDHFRGFAAYWAVPAGEPTAINGTWVRGPGTALFEAVRAALGSLPIIAEDLGVITPDVEALRDELGFPGMKVLQFAFGGDPDDQYLPHNYPVRCVVYTGTHDNDTTTGWWYALAEHERRNVQLYLGRDGSDISWDFIRIAFASVAETALVPMQDVFGLGSEGRMNTPGRAAGNWGWRYTADMLTYELAERLGTLTRIYGRARPAATE
ncbi:4-alpha-glucanotransferase [Kouleothrix aurantiaca]|uniref:4-alpha-glucanotransferase n=1 Tax=Kouleothrix aurantiaca TaxID=186479 RepID=A0A0P9D5C7_9CHLR|nr:4-alpha-glucanotransferase [Kouleothrix aurantiaca]